MAEKMKPSGIAWMDDIPHSWKCKKLKYLISKPLQYGANEEGCDFDETYPRYIRITDIEDNNQLKSDGKQSLLPAVAAPYILNDGDVLFARSGATVGKTFIYNSEVGCAAFAGYLIRASVDKKQILSKYLYYCTINSGYDNWKNSVFTQATIQNIGADKYAQFSIAFPPITEQQCIIDFLDTQCAKIDSVIADIEKQIETLQKYKKSLITETVTKGLNRSVPMKDSGIDWIGDIPMHWDIHRIKDTCSLARGGSPRPINEYLSDNPNDLNWIRIGDTVKGSKYIIQTEQKIIKSGLSNSRLVHEGDLLLTNSMSFGQPYILKITGCIHDGWLVFSDYRGIDKLFLYYALMSELCYIQFKTSVAGAVVENLSIDKVGISKIFVPPIEEQERIVKYLDAKCVIIDEILLKKEEQLETMKQHKKSLIYEYVTGKKRVTEVN